MLLVSNIYQTFRSKLHFSDDLLAICMVSANYYLLILEQLKTLVELYAKEKYILTVSRMLEDLKFLVSFKVYFEIPCKNCNMLLNLPGFGILPRLELQVSQ